MTETVDAPVQEQPAAEIPANYDVFTDKATAKYRWKKEKDEVGNLTVQRPGVELEIPVPSVEGFKRILAKGGKELALLSEAAYGVVREAVGEHLANNLEANQENIPWAQFSWEAIANKAKEDRKTIAPELWEAFGKDYIAVMPGVTGKSAEFAGTSVQVYLKKFSYVKTRKDILGVLKSHLTMYVENSKNAEQFEEIIAMLTHKVDMYLEANEADLLINNLGFGPA